MCNNIYIYHIPGVKVGVTRNLEKRVTEQQGYKPDEYEVLETSDDIAHISQREKYWQRKFGYEEDFNSYEKLSKQNRKGMDINITERTTTFPVNLRNLDEYLTDNLGFKFKTAHGKHILDDATANWINNNARVSHFDPGRSYVYNKTLAAWDEERKTEKAFTKNKSFVGSEVTRFDKIRAWAETRGLYDKGDLKTQFVKLQEEAGEVGRAILKNDSKGIQDGIGDMVVVLTNLAKLAGFTIEECIDHAYDEIKERTGKMTNGTFVKETL